MADLHIVREHTLGLTEARKIAFKWAETAEEEFGMSCTYEEGSETDEVCFARSGVSGQLSVTPTTFELSAKLGFLLGAFKGRIESEIVKNLDDLLAPKKPAKVAAKAAAKSSAKASKKASAKAVTQATASPAKARTPKT